MRTAGGLFMYPVGSGTSGRVHPKRAGDGGSMPSAYCLTLPMLVKWGVIGSFLLSPDGDLVSWAASIRRSAEIGRFTCSPTGSSSRFPILLYVLSSSLFPASRLIPRVRYRQVSIPMWLNPTATNPSVPIRNRMVYPIYITS